MGTLLNTAATASANTIDFTVDGINLPYTIISSPVLVSAEKATVQLKDNAGNYSDYYAEGVLQELTATNMTVTFYGPGTFRVTKDATVSSTTIIGLSNGNI